eukprot:TRINITY_DN9278_c0_g1_i1.p1 TRINITY_DN9278_c0_g1~~TRINITY_DN9278_c0_g1_i1.p1  ORF type:complete len:440 (-),score=62.16 TRINITY_DN9278_c0_g1_i1:128-1447(-)
MIIPQRIVTFVSSLLILSKSWCCKEDTQNTETIGRKKKDDRLSYSVPRTNTNTTSSFTPFYLSPPTSSVRLDSPTHASSILSEDIAAAIEAGLTREDYSFTHEPNPKFNSLPCSRAIEPFSTFLKFSMGVAFEWIFGGYEDTPIPKVEQSKRLDLPVKVEWFSYPMLPSNWGQLVGRTIVVGNNTYRVKKVLSAQHRSAVFEVTNGKKERILKICTKGELSNLRKFQHKNIIEVYEWDECIGSEDFSCFVMEKAKFTLTDWVWDNRKTKRSDKERFIRQILEVINYVHSKNYIVRDISPNNFVLVKDEKTKKLNVKMIDFEGVLRVSESGVVVIDGRDVIYTPGFQAPELPSNIKRGDQILCSKQQDTFSAAVVCFYVMCGSILDLQEESNMRNHTWNKRYELAMRDENTVNPLIGKEIISLTKFYPKQRGSLVEALKN